MSNKLVQSIIDNRTPCVFVSPHLDDAILSCGDLINYLSDKTEVVIVNVFTKGDAGPQTWYTRRFMRLCGSTDAGQMFVERKAEEAAILRPLGIKNVCLDFIDAAWRKGVRYKFIPQFLRRLVPEFRHLYPIHVLHITSERIMAEDAPMQREIAEKIRGIVAEHPDAYVFCPLARQSHVDHVIVRQACLSLGHDKLVLWSDFPYNKTGAVYDLPDLDLMNFEFNDNPQKKYALASGYQTQIPFLFLHDEFRLVSERYYHSPALAGRFAGRKPTVTIGIPAHNEALGIAALLESILAQQRDNFILEKIVVACDGCTDNTAEIVQDYIRKHSLVQLIDDKQRLGQGGRLNNFFRDNTSDIFITFDGDCLPAHKRVVSLLVQKFNNPEVGLVGGNYIPRPGQTFFDRALAENHFLWQQIRSEFRGGLNIHNHLGCISSMSREFARIAHIPDGVTGNDCYIYAQAVSGGFKFAFTHEAYVYIQMPRNLRDFIMQVNRFVNNGQSMNEHFGKEIMDQVNIPLTLKLTVIFRRFLRHPVLLSAAMAIRVTAAIVGLFIHVNFSNGMWDQIKSSKVSS